MSTNVYSVMSQEMRLAALRRLLVVYALGAIVVVVFFPNMGNYALPGLFGMLVLLACAVLFAVSGRSQHLGAYLFIAGNLVLLAYVWQQFPGYAAHWSMVVTMLGAVAVAGIGAGAVATLLACLCPWVALGADGWGDSASYGVVGSMLLGWFAYGLVFQVLWPMREHLMWAQSEHEDASEKLNHARYQLLRLKQTLEDLDLARREVVRLNDLLSAAREVVDEARRAKEQFVANVSHELRTPLNLIIGFSDEILNRPGLYSDNLPQELLGDIAVIKENSEQLARLVDDVLDLVEADTGYMRLTRSFTDLTGLIEDTNEAMERLFISKGLSLDMDVSEDLPKVYCDSVRIRQVLLNLLSNSVRYTERGGVVLKARLVENEVIVSVADSGSGMDPAIVNRMFEPFQQSDPSLRRRYGGTGLGLAISKQFVERHGGRIWIDSAPNVGTTVFFTLPVDVPEESTVATRRWFSPYQDYTLRIRTQPSRARTPKSEPTIVVVEKDAVLSTILSRYVQDLEVTVAFDLQQVAGHIEARAGRAIVIRQRGSGSDSVLSNVEDSTLDVPVIECFFDPGIGEGRNGQRSIEYLTKPFRRPQLLEAIGKLAPNARRVLVADDDSQARTLYCRMLGAPDVQFETAQAGNGREALEFMREWHPDIVLLDLFMPNVDGFAVLDERAEDPLLRSIPVILISARDKLSGPITGRAIHVTRQEGLTGRDMAMAINALVRALPPRYAFPERSETPRQLLASE